MSTASKSLLTAVSLAEVDEWNGFLVAVSVSVFPLLLRYKRRLRDGNVNHKMFTNSKEKYSTIFMSASDSLLHLYTLRCLKLACKHTHTEHNAVSVRIETAQSVTSNSKKDTPSVQKYLAL